MSGHSRWSPGQHPFNDEWMAQYIQGYILACQDALKDLDEEWIRIPIDPPDSVVSYWRGYREALVRTRGTITKSRNEAQMTLKVVQGKIEDVTE